MDLPKSIFSVPPKKTDEALARFRLTTIQLEETILDAIEEEYARHAELFTKVLRAKTLLRSEKARLLRDFPELAKNAAND